MGSDIYRNLLIGGALMGLFTVLIVIVVFEMGTNYGVSPARMNEATAGAYDKTELESEILMSDQTAETFRKRFEGGKVDDIDDASGVFAVGGDFVSTVVAPFNVIAKIGKSYFGFPEVFTHTIFAIINITIIFGLWSLLRKGD